MAGINAIYDWDWRAAEEEVLEARKFGGRTNAEIEAVLAVNAGKCDQAVQLGRAALARDPLNADVHAAHAYDVYLRCGRYAEAETALRRALAISPEYGSGYYFLGLSLLLQGRLDEALAAMQHEKAGDGRYEGIAIVYYAMGRKDASDAALRHAIELHSESYPTFIARVHAFRGELDQAMEWFERAYSLKATELYVIKHDPLVRNLERDPRYKAFLRKMNLPE
jgi:tetratricopeptide (TPR) repeat protein